MLDSVRPWGAKVRDYRSSWIETTVCEAAWQERAYWDLRRRVFVQEQSLFQGSDRDEHDQHAMPIVALSTCHGMPEQVIGVVRIYPAAPLAGRCTWYGGRLGVSRAYRRHGIVGERLIKRAVGTARGLGCECFLATVQLPNVRYFERHHFVVQGRVELLGVPHALMQARVERFEALPCPVNAGQPMAIVTAAGEVAA